MIMTENKRDVFFHVDDWKQGARCATKESAFGLYIVFVEFTIPPDQNARGGERRVRTSLLKRERLQLPVDAPDILWSRRPGLDAFARGCHYRRCDALRRAAAMLGQRRTVTARQRGPRRTETVWGGRQRLPRSLKAPDAFEGVLFFAEAAVR